MAVLHNLHSNYYPTHPSVLYYGSVFLDVAGAPYGNWGLYADPCASGLDSLNWIIFFPPVHR